MKTPIRRRKKDPLKLLLTLLILDTLIYPLLRKKKIYILYKAIYPLIYPLLRKKKIVTLSKKER